MKIIGLQLLAKSPHGLHVLGRFVQSGASPCERRPDGTGTELGGRPTNTLHRCQTTFPQKDHLWRG